MKCYLQTWENENYLQFFFFFLQSLQPFTFQMSKTICNTKFIVDFQGQIGQKGQKGHLFSPVCFSPGARGDLACNGPVILDQKN